MKKKGCKNISSHAMPLKNLRAFFSAMYVANEDSGQRRLKHSPHKETRSPASPAAPSFSQKRTLLGPEPKFSSQELTKLSLEF